MERATSVVLFCLAVDPLICALHNVSAFLCLTAYMDDNSAAAKGVGSMKRRRLSRLPTQQVCNLQVLQHNCFQIGVCNLHCLSVEVGEAFLTYGLATFPANLIPPNNRLGVGLPSLSLALSSLTETNHRPLVQNLIVLLGQLKDSSCLLIVSGNHSFAFASAKHQQAFTIR